MWFGVFCFFRFLPPPPPPPFLAQQHGSCLTVSNGLDKEEKVRKPTPRETSDSGSGSFLWQTLREHGYPKMGANLVLAFEIIENTSKPSLKRSRRREAGIKIGGS